MLNTIDHDELAGVTGRFVTACERSSVAAQFAHASDQEESWSCTKSSARALVLDRSVTRTYLFVMQRSLGADPATADDVFETLLAHILSGKRVAGSRLPGERDLSRKFGVSRTTLREAVRRLEAWNVLQTRRGVGISVRPYRDWSIEVISMYLQIGTQHAEQASLDVVLVDTLAMRRAIIIEILRIAVARVPPNGMRSARLAAARAWSLRDEPTYARAELEILREIVSATSFTPGLWLLNRMTDAALSPLWLTPRPSDDYVGLHAKFFDLVEAGAADEAIVLMREYLERRDQRHLDGLRRRLASESAPTERPERDDHRFRN